MFCAKSNKYNSQTRKRKSEKVQRIWDGFSTHRCYVFAEI